MRHPQLLIYEKDGRLAAHLQHVRQERGLSWAIWEPREVDACLRLLARGGPSVLVVKVGRDVERELALVERVAWLAPATAVIVVGDIDHPSLAGLAWDLGASFVLFPPLPREQLADIVQGFLPSASGTPPEDRHA